MFNISYQPKPITIENQRWDPVSAGSSVLLSVLFDFTVGFGQVFAGPAKAFQGKEEGGGKKEAAVTFGKGFGKMVGVLPKATLVDFPLAITEGLHHLPRLYGDRVRNHGQVKDWKSGGVVAGKVHYEHNSCSLKSARTDEFWILDIRVWFRGRAVRGCHQAL